MSESNGESLLKRASKFCIGVGVLFSLFVIPTAADAATKYWIGPAGGNVSDNANWSTSSGGANNTTAPTSADIAVFDGGDTDSATVDASHSGSLLGIQLNSGYTGTVTLARTLSIGTSDFSQAAGTFALSSHTLTFVTSDFTISGGTFNAGTGTVVFDGNAQTVNINTTLTLFNVAFDTSNSVQYVTISSGDTLIVTGTLTLTGGAANGPGVLKMQGTNTVVGSTGTSGSLVVQYLEAGDQTITGSGGDIPGVLINKPSGSITQSGDIDIATADFTLQSGTYNVGAGILTLISADFTISGGTFNADTGTVVFDGNAQTVNINTTQELNNVTFDSTNTSQVVTISSGDTLIVTGTLTFSGGGANGPGVVEMRGSNTVVGATGTNGSLVVQYLEAGDQTITGSGGYVPGLVINKPSGSITQSGDINIGSADFSLQSGTYHTGSGSFTLFTADFTISGGTFNAGTGTVVFDGNAQTVNINTTQELNNVTFDTASSVQYVTISSGDTLIVTGTLTFSGGAANGPGGVEMQGANTVVGSTGTSGSLVVQYLETGDQTITGSGGYIPGILINKPSGSITQSGDIDIASADFTLQSGTYNAGSGTITFVTSDFTISGGTFNANTGTVFFSGNDSTLNVDNSLTLNNVTFAMTNSSQELTIATGDTLVVAGTLTLTTGAVNGPGVLEMEGVSTVVGATGTIGTAPVQYLVAGDQTITGSGGYMPGILINKPSGSITQSGDIDIASSDFTLQSGTYNAGSGSITFVTADFISTGGTFDAQTSTVIFTGTDSIFNVNTTLSLYNATFQQTNSTQEVTIASGDTMVVTGTLTFNGLGKVDGPGIIEMRGATTVVAGLAAGTVEITFAGSAEQTYQLTSGDEPNGDVTINKSGGALTLLSNFDLDATGQALTISQGTLKLAGFNLTVTDAFTIGASGILELRGSETVTAGSKSFNATSTVRFTGDGDTAVDSYTLTTLATSYGHLIVNSTDGATDTFAISATPFTVAGDFTLTAGAVTGGTATINVAGDWSNSGTFTANTSTVNFNGTSQVIIGSTTFYNFTKNVAAADTLTFTNGTTQIISNTWNVQGASGQLLSLRSSSTGSQWSINPQGTRTLGYLDVKDSNNVNATVISVAGLNVTNSGNNTNWAFMSVSSVTGQNPQTTAGGKSITINGLYFVDAPTITIGGTSATSVVFVSATEVTAVAPAKAAGSYDVVVTNPDSSVSTCSDCMTYVAPPTVTSINQTYAKTAGGQSRTITGSGMKVGASGVVIDPSGTADAVTTTNTSSSVIFTTPVHAAGSVVVRVYGTGGTNDNGIYTDTASGFVVFEAIPTFTAIDEAYAPTVGSGTRTITGTGIKVGASGAKVGSTTVTTSGLATSVTFTPPDAAAGAVAIRLYSTNGTDDNGIYVDATDALTYEAKPTVTTVSPSTGLDTAGGDSVTISGSGIKVGANGAVVDPAGTADVVTTTGVSTAALFSTPAHTAGAVTLRVYSPNGTNDNGIYTDYASITFAAAATPDPDPTPSSSGGVVLPCALDLKPERYLASMRSITSAVPRLVNVHFSYPLDEIRAIAIGNAGLFKDSDYQPASYTRRWMRTTANGPVYVQFLDICGRRVLRVLSDTKATPSPISTKPVISDTSETDGVFLVVSVPRNLAAERNAITAFRFAFKRAPSNSVDWSAVNYLAYGGEVVVRDVVKERAGLTKYRRLYSATPSNGYQWRLLHIISYVP